jgi:ADP-sugar diphosphatase
MQKYVRNIDLELRQCMDQLQALGANLPGADAGLKWNKLTGEDTLYTVQIGDQTVLVTRDQANLPFVAHEKFEKIFEMKAFVDWCKNIEPELLQRATIQTIFIQDIDFFGPRVGFLKFRADVLYHGDDKPINSIVFMRGGAVAILMLLRCEGKIYTVTVIQPRIPAGKYQFREIPAGMLDDSNDFGGTAAKEIKEETGIIMNATDLVDMTANLYGDDVLGLYPSIGGCDEFIRYFLFAKEVDAAELAEIQGRSTGVLDEGEKIKVDVIPLKDLHKKSPDMNTTTALYLYGHVPLNRVTWSRVKLAPKKPH